MTLSRMLQTVLIAHICPSETLFVYAANLDKTEICFRNSENQAQSETGIVVIEDVKNNFAGRGTVSSSHRELESFVLGICTRAG